MKTFAVRSEIVTPKSSEYGDSETELYEADLSLRDALAMVRNTRTCAVGGIECIEADSMPLRAPHRVRSVRILNGMEFETGACETRTLFIPDTVSGASSRRIARLLGV